LIALGLVLMSGMSLPSARAQEPVKTTFVRLGPGVPGLLYEPAAPGAKAAIAVFVMHAEADYLQFSACTELAKRGYRVLCANNSTGKSGLDSDLYMDRILLDAKLAVSYLRSLPGVRKVVLFGHSGGAVLMSSYQAIAEQGLKACQGPEKIVKCSDSLAGLPPADGLMLVDPNYGLSTMMLFSIDPAVTDERSGKRSNPQLDLFDPGNGFDPHGPHYGEAFIHRFQSAVGQRNNRLIQTALQRLHELDAGRGSFSDDEPLVIPGAYFTGANNKLFSQDPQLLSHTREARPLLHKDGRVTTEIVHTVRVPENMSSTTPSLQRGALRTTVRHFLATFAVRVGNDFGYDESAIRGVDWASSYTTPPGSVEHIKVPLLTMGMTGHWEFLAAEVAYDHARSADKSIAFVEGATHVYTPCDACAKTPGEFGDTVRTLYDYVDGWLSKPGRF
jgi:hypothetical protein